MKRDAFCVMRLNCRDEKALEKERFEKKNKSKRFWGGFYVWLNSLLTKPILQIQVFLKFISFSILLIQIFFFRTYWFQWEETFETMGKAGQNPAFYEFTFRQFFDADDTSSSRERFRPGLGSIIDTAKSDTSKSSGSDKSRRERLVIEEKSDDSSTAIWSLQFLMQDSRESTKLIKKKFSSKFPNITPYIPEPNSNSTSCSL